MADLPADDSLPLTFMVLLGRIAQLVSFAGHRCCAIAFRVLASWSLHNNVVEWLGFGQLYLG